MEAFTSGMVDNPAYRMRDELNSKPGLWVGLLNVDQVLLVELTLRDTDEAPRERSVRAVRVCQTPRVLGSHAGLPTGIMSCGRIIVALYNIPSHGTWGARDVQGPPPQWYGPLDDGCGPDPYPVMMIGKTVSSLQYTSSMHTRSYYSERRMSDCCAYMLAYGCRAYPLGVCGCDQCLVEGHVQVAHDVLDITHSSVGQY